MVINVAVIMGAARFPSNDVFLPILILGQIGAFVGLTGTALQKEGVAVFDRITKELKEIMEEKGYETLEDFRGKLHYID